jgi:hypothetical protein
MITPSFGLTATERVLPRLTLNFTTASLDSRITFARTGNNATVTNSSGLIAGINADLPRFDYDPITLVCKGLLIEQQSTNLLTYSEQFNDASWVKLNTTISANSIISPDGTTNADTMVETIASGFHRVSQSFTPSVTGSFTSSIFAKQGARIWLAIQNNFGANNTTQLYNLSTGALGSISGTGGTATITNVGNGWYRCTLTTVTSTLGAGACNIYVSSGDNLNTYTGDGTSGLYIWGAQLESLAFRTSYVPTVASQVTRSADVATMTGTNFSDWYSAGAGGAVARVLPSTVSGTRPSIQFDDSTADEIIALRGNTTNPELYIKDGGADQAQIDAGTIAANTAYNLGTAWNTDNCAAAVNGAAAVTDATATIPTVTQARLGSDGINYLNGHLQNLRYWPQRIINAEIQAFSKG